MDGSDTRWSHAKTGEAVWLTAQEGWSGWKPGVLVGVMGTSLIVKVGPQEYEVSLDEGGKVVSKFRMLPRDVTASENANGVRDMDDLANLHEASILCNIEKRFKSNLIYTRTGPILVALNPFKKMEIYSDEAIKQYHSHEYRDLEPHCFAEAEDALQCMQSSQQSQSLIICGESGAGKTETTKLMLKYLSEVTGFNNIAEKVMRSNPVTEAFGNAKTIRNNNSSRFGKFVRLIFKDGKIVGSSITNYLLEKCRTVAQTDRERNYHIFYQLCSGTTPAQKAALHLKDSSHFFYLNQSGCERIEGVDDAANFKETLQALEGFGCTQKTIKDILQVLSGILHLGNCKFVEKSGGSELDPPSLQSFKVASELLGLDCHAFQEAMCCRYVRVAGGEGIKTSLTVQQALALRDTVAKAVYEKLFDWLVVQINSSTDVDSATSDSFIGILDIYGFESLQMNGFEQLFINYANEVLQRLFNQEIFELEQEAFKAEGIPFDKATFPDNQTCLDIINGKPFGIFSLLDEECIRMGAGSDSALVNKIAKNNADNATFTQCGLRSRGVGKSLTSDHFQIKHYAGSIVYLCKDFIEKNKDTLYDHVVHLLHGANNSLLQDLYPKSSGSHKIQTTVVSRFSTNINQLLEVIQRTQPRFIRCIKTNNDLLPDKINQSSVLRQLRYAGVLAALQMRRSGYPNRLTYQDLATRCRSLIKGFSFTSARDKEHWLKLVESMLASESVRESISEDQVAFGKTRLFMRANILHRLDSLVQDSITESVITAQTATRSNLSRKRYARLRSSTISLQSLFRGRCTRRKHHAMLDRVAANKALSLAKIRLEKAESKMEQLEQSAQKLRAGSRAKVIYCNVAALETSIEQAKACVLSVRQAVESGSVEAKLQKNLEEALVTAFGQVDHSQRKTEDFDLTLDQFEKGVKALETEFEQSEEEAKSVVKVGTKRYEVLLESSNKVRREFADLRESLEILESVAVVEEALARAGAHVQRHVAVAKGAIQGQRDVEQSSSRLLKQLETAGAEFFSQSAAFSGFNHLQELSIGYAKVQRELDAASRLLRSETMGEEVASDGAGRVTEALKEYISLGRSAVDAHSLLHEQHDEAKTLTAEGKFTVLRLEQQYESLDNASPVIKQSFEDIRALLDDSIPEPKELTKLGDMLSLTQKMEGRAKLLRNSLASLTAAVQAERKLAHTWKLEKVRLQQDLEDKISLYQQVETQTRKRDEASLGSISNVMEAARVQVVESRRCFICSPAEILGAKQRIADTLEVLDAAMDELRADNDAFQRAMAQQKAVRQACDKEGSRLEAAWKLLESLQNVRFAEDEVVSTRCALEQAKAKIEFAEKLLRNENLLNIHCWRDVENNAKRAVKVVETAAAILCKAKAKVLRIKKHEEQQNRQLEESISRFHTCRASFEALACRIRNLNHDTKLINRVEETELVMARVEDSLAEVATADAVQEVEILVARAETSLEEAEAYADHRIKLEHWRAKAEEIRLEEEEKKTEELLEVDISKETALLTARRNSLESLNAAKQILMDSRSKKKAVQREFEAAASEVARAGAYFFEDVDSELILESCANALLCAQVLDKAISNLQRNIGSVAEVVNHGTHVDQMRERWKRAAVKLATLRCKGIHGYKKSCKTGFHRLLAPFMQSAERHQESADKAILQCTAYTRQRQAKLAVLRFENAVEKALMQDNQLSKQQALTQPKSTCNDDLYSSIQQFNLYQKTLAYVSSSVGSSSVTAKAYAHDAAVAALACCKRRLEVLEVAPLASKEQVLQFQASLELAGANIRRLEFLVKA